MADEPMTFFAQMLQSAMDAKGMGIQDVADKAESTYEHIRSMLRGKSFPSKYFMRILADVLELDMKAVEKAVTADKIRHKYGKIPYELAGKNPELEPVERVWPQLTKEQQQSFVAQMMAVAKQNKTAARK